MRCAKAFGLGRRDDAGDERKTRLLKVALNLKTEAAIAFWQTS